LGCEARTDRRRSERDRASSRPWLHRRLPLADDGWRRRRRGRWRRNLHAWLLAVPRVSRWR
jgi:hypothetical protein